MNKKGIILFDIDRTLIDTDKRSVLGNEAILKLLNTTDLDRVKLVKDKYRATLLNERDYEPRDYLKLLCDEFGFKDFDSLLNVYYGKEYLYTYKDAVFPETKTMLNLLHGKYRLGIYSEGVNEYQNNKFRSMDLNEYFEEDLIFIFDAKDTNEAIGKIPKESIIVDDKERICEFLTENGIKCIWLNKIDSRVSPNFPTIHNLLELPDILK